MQPRRKGRCPVSRECAPTADAGCGKTRAAADIAFIIDDDRLMAALLERHLAKRGIGAICFDDPVSLLDALPSAKPAYLFTDLDMPLMRGTELVTRARAGGFGGAIVLVTASREREDLIAAVANGADEILGKPLKDADLDFLLEKMRALARRSVSAVAPPRDLFEPIGQGIILLDEECVPIHVNRRAREILGAGDEREAGEILERRKLAALIMNDRRAGESVDFIDIPDPSGKGPSRLVGFEIRECAASPSGCSYLVLMHDFSEWRKLDELHLRFATCLSHRMRTPLTSVRNAVMILGEKGRLLDSAEKERFLDIGYRNIEKLMSSFDDLQSAFLVEVKDIDVWRSLIRIGTELGEILGEMETRGSISGFKLYSPDSALLTCRSRLKKYIITSVEAIGEWLGEIPSIECSVTMNDASGEAGEEPLLSISIRPRVGSRRGRMHLKDYCAEGDVPKGFMLDKFARALDGVHTSTDRDSFCLRLPLNPPFDRGKDLIHPLHMMIERSNLDRIPLHIVSTRIAGASSDARKFTRLFESNLCALGGKDKWVVVRGWEPGNFDVLVAGASPERIDDAMGSIRERFARCCRERGEELYPAIRWEIRYSHEPDASGEPVECAMLETLV
jgi:DNA-binding response OmpR family regulator